MRHTTSAAVLVRGDRFDLIRDKWHKNRGFTFYCTQLSSTNFKLTKVSMDIKLVEPNLFEAKSVS